MQCAQDGTEVSRETLQRSLRDLEGQGRLVLQNLCDQQVLQYDTKANRYRIKGELLRQWLPRMLADRRGGGGSWGPARGHENCFITMEGKFQEQHRTDRELPFEVLERAIRAIEADAKGESHLVLPVAFGNWDRFLAHQRLYSRVNPDFEFPRARFPREKDAAD